MPSTLAPGDAAPSFGARPTEPLERNDTPRSRPADPLAWGAAPPADAARPPAADADPARPLAADVAAGAALAAGSLAVAAIVALLTAFLRVAASGDDALTVGAAARLPLAAGFGLVAAACLLAATRPRATTLALAGVLPAAAVLSPVPAPALLAATVATGLAVAQDRRHPGRPLPLRPIVPALVALACLTLGLALARTGDVHRPAPRTTRAPRAATTHSRAATAAPHATPRPAATPPVGATPPAGSQASPPPAAATTPAATTPPAATPPPAATSPAAAGSPAALVAAYYAALDAQRFGAAWAVLAPGVRRSFGGFRRWRAGYSATVSSAPRRLVVTAQGGGAFAVRHVLVARDRAACGALVRRFAVAWEVVRRPEGSGWSVTSLTARPLRRGGSCS